MNMELPAFYARRKHILVYCPYLVENPLKISADYHAHGLGKPCLARGNSAVSEIHSEEQSEIFEDQSVATEDQEGFSQVT